MKTIRSTRPRSTRRFPLPCLLLALTLAAGLLTPAASAQELYTFTVGALGGFGGSLDADPGDDLGNLSYQLNFSIVTEPKTQLGLRLGQIDLDIDESFSLLDDADLTYLTVAGEYRFSETFYQSGIYLGLGAYRLEGIDRFLLTSEEDTSFGVALGLTGEFELTRSLGVLVELSGHYADLDAAQVFIMGHVGLAFHF